MLLRLHLHLHLHLLSCISTEHHSLLLLLSRLLLLLLLLSRLLPLLLLQSLLLLQPLLLSGLLLPLLLSRLLLQFPLLSSSSSTSTSPPGLLCTFSPPTRSTERSATAATTPHRHGNICIASSSASASPSFVLVVLRCFVCLYPATFLHEIKKSGRARLLHIKQRFDATLLHRASGSLTQD
eukprot:COSAG02_NODE_1538_length_12042_cov_323.842083_7_plen_181_part_00